MACTGVCTGVHVHYFQTHLKPQLGSRYWVLKDNALIFTLNKEKYLFVAQCNVSVMTGNGQEKMQCMYVLSWFYFVTLIWTGKKVM